MFQLLSVSLDEEHDMSLDIIISNNKSQDTSMKIRWYFFCLSDAIQCGNRASYLGTIFSDVNWLFIFAEY
jgi:hypothetical protein